MTDTNDTFERTEYELVGSIYNDICCDNGETCYNNKKRKLPKPPPSLYSITNYDNKFKTLTHKSQTDKKKLPNPPPPLRNDQITLFILTNVYHHRLIKICKHYIPMVSNNNIITLDNQWFPEKKWMKCGKDGYKLQQCECCLYIMNIFHGFGSKILLTKNEININ